MSTAIRKRSFLGTGWNFPPTFSRHSNSLLMVSDEKNIQQSLWTLLSTIPSERVMLPRYGCELWRMVFRSIDTTLMTELRDFIRTAILYWEPRIQVEDILVKPDATAAGLVLITVNYTVITTNTRNNLVYPFYIQEGTLAAQTLQVP
jgi:hypothetical protein